MLVFGWIVPCLWSHILVHKRLALMLSVHGLTVSLLLCILLLILAKQQCCDHVSRCLEVGRRGGFAF